MRTVSRVLILMLILVQGLGGLSWSAGVSATAPPVDKSLESLIGPPSSRFT